MLLSGICGISLQTNLCNMKMICCTRESSLKAEMRFKLQELTVSMNSQDYASWNVANFKKIFNTEN